MFSWQNQQTLSKYAHVHSRPTFSHHFLVPTWHDPQFHQLAVLIVNIWGPNTKFIEHCCRWSWYRFCFINPCNCWKQVWEIFMGPVNRDRRMSGKRKKKFEEIRFLLGRSSAWCSLSILGSSELVKKNWCFRKLHAFSPHQKKNRCNRHFCRCIMPHTYQCLLNWSKFDQNGTVHLKQTV